MKSGTSNALLPIALSDRSGALSTAHLYGPTKPGGPPYGLNNSNPFNPDLLPQDAQDAPDLAKLANVLTMGAKSCA
jgi:hypothetical protein